MSMSVGDLLEMLDAEGAEGADMIDERGGYLNWRVHSTGGKASLTVTFTSDESGGEVVTKTWKLRQHATEADYRASFINQNFPDDESTFFYMDNEEMVEERQLSSSRWTERIRRIYRLSDNSHLAVEETEGLTEMQDGVEPCPFAYAVEPQPVTVIEYVEV